MKLCACCSAAAEREAPTCANCGEASWLDAGSVPPPALELAEAVIGGGLAAGSNETPKRKRGR